MKLTTFLLLSLTFLLSSCKSEDSATTETPTEPSVSIVRKKKDAPVSEQPAPVVVAPATKPVEPTPEPESAPVVKPKKMSLEELAANINTDPKAVAKEMNNLQKELADLMESIVDKESAEVAIFELDPIIDDLITLGEAIGSADEEAGATIKAEFQKTAPKTQARLQEAGMKALTVFMSEPSLAPQMQETMKKLMQARKAGQ